ncbi:hypothetical protein DYB25_009596 [Aphanomyces astaci]|uniref:Peptidase M14 domain-containing protein n=1 Tax=Aphanomyces astaci TaxID=112090 RepID=A0A397BNW6_APHAT|nr:hypothetical protein DYB25_009596 [Aphanomyces astaci]
MKFTLLSAIALFAAATAETNNTITGIDGRARSLEQEAAFQTDAETNRACHDTNANYISSLKAGQYTSSAFHNCFHTIDQIYEFADELMAQNPTLLSKFVISKTYNGATIYGYKLTKGHSQSLYFQAQVHAREWIAGASILFSFASILDDIANEKPTAADAYDLYFVPIVNIDGFESTWNGNGTRFQRKNANQVDLNRNWPTRMKNPSPPPQDDETYPGEKPFSEPETAGINAWMETKRDEIHGYLDIHAYGGLLLYPSADTKEPIGDGLDEKFQVLGRGMKNVMGEYKPQPASALYLSYGTFRDYAFREFKKPALTIEVVGYNFITKASTIKRRGAEVYKGINKFAKEVTLFNGGGDTKPPSPTSTSKPSPTTAPSATTSSPGTEPVTPSPAVTEPVTPSPTVTEQPVTPTPSRSKPVTPSPAVTEPVTLSPSVTEPVTPSPAVTEPVTPSPSVTKPVTPTPSGSCNGCSGCYSALLSHCFPRGYSRAQCDSFNGAGYQTTWCGNY